MESSVHAVRDDAIGTSDMVDLLHRLRRRTVSPAELRSAAQSRLAAVDPGLNAVVMPVDVGCGDGPLAGIPTVIKDNEELTGYPTTLGSQAVPDRPSRSTSRFLQHYLSLGLAPLAKTSLSEFGLTASTESPLLGATRNPWDPGHSVGGSSGGSAALVAAGAVPIGHANDGGGSIRIPASCCGLVGLKPSRGRIPDRPENDRLPVPLLAQGVVTRTVRDTAAFFAASERAWRNPALPSIGDVRGPSHRRLRIAVVRSGLHGIPLDADVLAAVDEAAALCERLGHHVAEIDFPYGHDFATDFLRYWSLLAWSLLRFGRQLYGHGFDPANTTVFTRGLAQYAGQRLERIAGSIRRLRRVSATARLRQPTFDMQLCATLGHLPPPIGYLGYDLTFREQIIRLIRFTTITPVQSISGEPAISLPLGRSADGRLPIGIHFAGALGSERMLLELAYELEEAAPFSHLG